VTARGRCRGVGADQWSDKRYSHCLEFSETCLECQRNVGEFYFVAWWEPCRWFMNVRWCLAEGLGNRRSMPPWVLGGASLAQEDLQLIRFCVVLNLPSAVLICRGPQFSVANFSSFHGAVCQIPRLTVSNFPHVVLNFLWAYMQYLSPVAATDGYNSVIRVKVKKVKGTV